MEPEAGDVPSPIDFQSEADARDWTARAMQRRPHRSTIFAAISSALREAGAHDVLELGSGPGFLAERVLADHPHVVYTALDFSAAMHALARERLRGDAARIRWVHADFKAEGWWRGLGAFDGVLTSQAVHELRHKRHAPALYRAVHGLLRPGGLFLLSDHFAGEGGMENTALYMTPDEQVRALEDAGFETPQIVTRGDGLVLFRCRRA